MGRLGAGGGGGLAPSPLLAVSLSVILVMAFIQQQRLVAASNCVLFCVFALLDQPEYAASETPAPVGSVPFSEICTSAPSTLLRFEVLTTCPLPSCPAALGGGSFLKLLSVLPYCPLLSFQSSSTCLMNTPH